MGYTVRLRKNSTGEIRARSYDDEWDYVQAYSWEDGGFACDCNRDLEFQRAALPESEVDWSTGKCGESECTALDVSLPDGSVIPLEQENTMEEKPSTEHAPFDRDPEPVPQPAPAPAPVPSEPAQPEDEK